MLHIRFDHLWGRGTRPGTRTHLFWLFLVPIWSCVDLVGGLLLLNHAVLGELGSSSIRPNDSILVPHM